MSNLNQLAGRITGSFLSAAVNNRNFFVNDIPADLPVSYNREWLATVLSGMLAVVVSHAHNACIRLSARKYGCIIVLEIQQVGKIANYTRDQGLQQVEQLAEKIGGCVHLTLRNTEMKVLSLSYPNLPMIA
jgi:hypothetical protein